ncbi:MAG: hypothetical protein BGO21_19260 [Dyadobacter sp. 50-39]|nr:MAG: hypothetical protein BGO21_19260 [Dyadobacter sp. 50-39]
MGGGGAGESYQTETTDHFSGDLNGSAPFGSDFIESNGFDSTTNDAWANDPAACNPGTIDSGTNDADSNNSSFSDSGGYSQDQ